MTLRILVLSDLHLRGPESDSRYDSFINVLKGFKNSSYDELILMGDIFDILIGPYNFWKKIHPEFFSLLEQIARQKKVQWVQGNHDFQLSGLLKKIGVEWIQDGALLERSSQRIYVNHGDLADKREKVHALWRKIHNSAAFGLGLKLIHEKLGEKLLYPLALRWSHASRRSSSARAESNHENEMRNIFQEYALELSKKYSATLIILGHSHLQEDTQLDSRIRYLNVGDWFKDQPVGIVEIEEDGNLKTKLCSAKAWLHECSST